MASEEMQAVVAYITDMMQQSGMPMFGEKIDPVVLRQTIEEAQAAMPLEPDVEFIQGTLGGLEAELSLPEGARQDALILYMHGGGLVCGNAGTSRGYASLLAGEAKIPVWSFSYRLAPEDPYPAAVDDAFGAYRDALARTPGVPIFVIGESSGAYLSLTTALKARDAGIQAPAGVILYSPVIDFSETIDRSKCGWADNTVTEAGLRALRDLYCPDPAVWKEPTCSPLFGDFRGFPPALVAWDTGETLAADAEKMVELLQAAGVELESKAYEGCFHAFAPVGRNAPESDELLRNTVAFMARHIA